MCKDLNYIINHVFLPPKLPQKDDSNAAKDSSLLEEVLTALKSFQAQIPEQERSEWIPCIKMVRNMLQIRGHFGGLVAEEVETTLMAMADGGTNWSASGNRSELMRLAFRYPGVACPLPECGTHRPEIFRGILIRVVRSLTNL